MAPLVETAGGKNACVVKYIHLKSVDVDKLHTLADYELELKRVLHSSYEELHEQVFQNCPAGYACAEPLALYHELLWSSGLALRRDGRRAVLERDVLHHAIEAGEYDLFWNVPNPVGTICVDVVESPRPDQPTDAEIPAPHSLLV